MFGANVLQSIDGVAIVEVPGLLWRQLSTLSRVELYGIPYFWRWSTNSSELRTQFHSDRARAKIVEVEAAHAISIRFMRPKG